MRSAADSADALLATLVCYFGAEARARLKYREKNGTRDPFCRGISSALFATNGARELSLLAGWQLRESGFIEAENLRIEYRWAENQIDRLPALAADLVSRRVAAIATVGGPPSIRAAKAATATIP